MFIIKYIDWLHTPINLSLRCMTNPGTPSRRSVGDRIPPIQLVTLTHGTIDVPGSRLTHLQFRRFAGCPVCNLHLRSFAQGHARLLAAEIQTVAFFHSSAKLMMPYQGALPFPSVPDPDREWYRTFGVERSLLAAAYPQVMWSAMRGLVGAP